MPRRREPLWVSRLVLEAVHFDLLRAHGGMPGLRDDGALEAALARPLQRWSYRRDADLAELAAAYGFGLTRGHPYNDGNKRTAFMAMAVFAGLNGCEIEASEADVVDVMIRLAAGRLSEAALAKRIRQHLRKVKPNDERA
jgi:death-on-curing protein